MASPITKQEKREQILRNMQLTIDPVIFTFRGEWQPETEYRKNDYVYSPDAPGYLFLVKEPGTSQSATKGTTGNVEPLWNMLASAVYDGPMQFVPKEVDETIAYQAVKWKPGIQVNTGDFIVPSTGPMIIYGQEKQYYVFQLKRCITTIDWPKVPKEYVQDNDVIWECRLSYSKLLPHVRRQEPMYKELVEIMDFLNLHEEIFFDDLVYKYADQMRLRIPSIKEVMAEFGYNYITNFVGLTDKELQTALTYISLIHYLKGSEQGLSLVFELLGVTARWEEWWESEPKGIPDTWKLWIDIDIERATGYFADKVINFTRQYVYPVMQEFEVTYKVDLIEVGIAIAGFFNAEYQWILNPGTMLMDGIGTFLDREYTFKLDATVSGVLGKEGVYLGKSFGFWSIHGKVGSWGTNWATLVSAENDRIPYSGRPGGNVNNIPGIYGDDPWVLLSVDMDQIINTPEDGGTPARKTFLLENEPIDPDNKDSEDK